jgi:3-deoxy-7-phosphoheptulonate synthase
LTSGKSAKKKGFRTSILFPMNISWFPKSGRLKPTSIDLGDGVYIKDGDMAIMAGPCSIESEEQIIKVINHLKENGIKMMRGGVFKPRSSPYAFQRIGN